MYHVFIFIFVYIPLFSLGKAQHLSGEGDTKKRWSRKRYVGRSSSECNEEEATSHAPSPSLGDARHRAR
jgi:hypothetical protein